MLSEAAVVICAKHAASIVALNTSEKVDISVAISFS